MQRQKTPGDSVPRGGEVEYLHRNPASRRKRRKGKTGRQSQGPAAIVNDIPVLSSESAPYQQTRNCPTDIKIWSQAPDGCFIPRQTGRRTAGRKDSTRRRQKKSLIYEA
jgi:hypothetical protein